MTDVYDMANRIISILILLLEQFIGYFISLVKMINVIENTHFASRYTVVEKVRNIFKKSFSYLL